MDQMNLLYAGAGNGVLQQPSALKKRYESRAGNKSVGTLHWPKVLSSLCVAETAGGSWTFKWRGVFKLRITARVAGSEQDVLVYRPNWTGVNGTITHIDGRELKLRTNLWGQRFTLMQKQAQGGDIELLTVKINFSFLRGSAQVTSRPKLAQMEDAPLLAMFSCYLALMAYETCSS